MKVVNQKLNQHFESCDNWNPIVRQLLSSKDNDFRIVKWISFL